MKNTIEKLLRSTNRTGIDGLINHLESINFYKSPCSGAYHLSKEGGLAEHSLNVYNFGANNLSMLIDYASSWIIVSLLHDVGKADYRGKPNYVPNYLKSGELSTAKPYETNKDRLYISHEIVSLQIISKYIELTEEEEFAILYHNGLYVASGRDIQGKERPLQQILHFADMYCSRFIEDK